MFLFSQLVKPCTKTINLSRMKMITIHELREIDYRRKTVHCDWCVITVLQNKSRGKKCYDGCKLLSEQIVKIIYMEATSFIRNNFLIPSCYSFFNIHVLEKRTRCTFVKREIIIPFYPSSPFPCDWKMFCNNNF